MAFRKSLELKKSKSKGFSLPKCFQLSGLTKTLFPCKSTTQRNNDNYVFFSYESKSSSEPNSTHNPATSTMIDYVDSNACSTANTRNSQNRFHVSNITQHQNDYYVLESDSFDNYQPYQYYNQVFDESDHETPRSSFISVSSISTCYNDYDDLTIVKHNNSPLVELTLNRSEDSLNNTTEYLHSTKIFSEPHNYEMPNSLSPLPTNKQSTLLHSPVSTTDSTSSSMSSYHSRFQEISSGLQSLIDGISEIIEDSSREETHVCTCDYEATFVDDVTVQFADTIQILRDNNDDWIYVQVSTDGRKGFIPKSIVTEMKAFIHQLKERQSQLSLTFSQLDLHHKH